MRNIFLIGPMGSGKTTIGRSLATKLVLEFIDSDEEIEHAAGADIPWIFDIEGEQGFRARERKVIAELTKKNNILLATGGGAIVDEVTRNNLKERGFIIYLHATVETQLRRTKRSNNRPLLKTDNPKARLAELFEQRDPLYRQVADLVIESGAYKVQAVVQKIIIEIQSHPAMMENQEPTNE